MFNGFRYMVYRIGDEVAFPYKVQGRFCKCYFDLIFISIVGGIVERVCKDFYGKGCLNCVVTCYRDGFCLCFF